MRRASGAIALGIASSLLAACAALTGLDQITESDCVPGGCADATPTVDSSARVDAGMQAETGAPDSGAPARDTGAGADVAEAPDGGVEADAGPVLDSPGGGDAEAGGDAIADAMQDTGVDAPPDSGAPLDAPVDSPCGIVYLSESFGSADGGWALDSTWSIAPTCANPPTPAKGYPDPTVDHTSGAAGGVAGVYVCGDNPTGTTSPFRYATSPAVDVSSAPALKLEFYRWLNSDRDGWMTSTVDVYDGTQWVNLYTNATGAIVADDAWTKVEYDVTAQKNAAFRVRFGYAVTDSGVYAMSCWNVDDVTLSTASCP